MKVIAGNAATIICLRANPEDEAFILPYMKPEVERGDIVNLAPYHFYMKVATDESEEAFSGQTVPLDLEENEEVAEAVRISSRKEFAMPRAEVEKQMEELFSDGNATKEKKRVVTTRRENAKTSQEGKLRGL